MALDEAYRTGLKVIRKEYKATIRNRGGKLYLMVKWAHRNSWMPWNGHVAYSHFDEACKMVNQLWPDAYVTSASAMSDATFRLNP